MSQKSKYEFGSYDKYGNLNGAYVVGIVIFIFIVSFIFSIIVFLESYNYKILISSLFSEFKNIYTISKIGGFSSAFKTYFFYLLLGFILIAYYLIDTISKKLEQRKLANFGLENYYLKKKLKDGYIYEVVPGKVIN